MYYDIMESVLGPILLGHNGEGINRVHFLGSPKPSPKIDNWKKLSRDPLLQKARKQLEAYFSGKRHHFSLPLSFEGTDFQVRVWKALITVPYGTTWSYKELAIAIGNPAACQAVGGANGKNRLSVIIP